MFFSIEIKDELAKIFPSRTCCRTAILAAFFDFNATERKLQYKISIGPAAITRLILKLIKSSPSDKINFCLQKIKSSSRKSRYYIQFKSLPEKLKNKFPSINFLLNKKCCQRSYLRGAFLVTGSINTPGKGYHLEWMTSNLSQAKQLIKLLKNYKLKFKIFKRGRRYVVYTKKADIISKVLNILGAHKKLLHFEGVRALKETKSEIQRVVNFETANLNRTAYTAFRQIRKINFLKNKIGFKKLPLRSSQTAKMRLKHPEASFRELGSYFKPKLSKSSVSSSLRALEDLADELRKG